MVWFQESSKTSILMRLWKIGRTILLGKSLKMLLLLACTGLMFSMSLAAQEKTYVIQDITFHITGRTWERALEKRIDVRIGRTFASKAALEAYILDRQQVLINQRVLAEGSVTYNTSDLPDGRTAVHLIVATKDTWNVIVLPYFKYDSNSGLLLSLRARDFNFLGSMETLKLNLDYTFTNSNENEFGQDLSFSVPFRLVDHDWRFSLAQGLTYNADKDNYEFDITTSTAIAFPIRKQDWSLTFTQAYYYNKLDGYGDTAHNLSSVSFGTAFELPLELGRLGALRYGPAVFTQVRYRFGREISEERRGVEPGFTHSLFAERVDWLGNFRDGAELSLGNTYIYNPREDVWKNSVDWKFTGHKALPWIGFSGRLSGFFQFDKERGLEEDDNVGEPIRGILDDRLRGDAGLFINTDIAVKMWTWFLAPYFEVQAGPFFDFALVKNRGDYFKLDEMYYGGGIQVVVFPKFARSLYLRASLGFDLEAVLDDYQIRGFAPRLDDDGKRWKRWEAFIGLGHHY